MLCIVVVIGGMFSYEDKFIFTFSHQTDQTACHWTLNRFLLTTHSLPLKISLRAKACPASHQNSGEEMWRLVVFLSLMDHLIFCLDNGLAKTPPMGWLAWERYELNISIVTRSHLVLVLKVPVQHRLLGVSRALHQ